MVNLVKHLAYQFLLIIIIFFSNNFLYFLVMIACLCSSRDCFTCSCIFDRILHRQVNVRKGKRRFIYKGADYFFISTLLRKTTNFNLKIRNFENNMPMHAFRSIDFFFGGGGKKKTKTQFFIKKGPTPYYPN